MRYIKINLPQNWVLPLAILFLLLLLFILETPMLRFSGGRLIYPQDDAYLRLATAQNIAHNGVWGLSPHGFNAASSSILYPLLLAAFFKIFGTLAYIPWIIGLVTSLAWIVILQKWLAKQQLAPWQQLLVLIAIIYLAPLHVMVATGMEHALQILLSFLFIFKFCEWLPSRSESKGYTAGFPMILYVYALLLTATRYEGLLVVGVACTGLLTRRKWLTAIILAGVALVPAVLYGVYAVRQGGYFIPNSILIKGVPLPVNGESIRNFFSTEVVNRLLYPFPTRGGLAANRLLILLPLTCWLYRDALRQEKAYRYILYLVLATCALHVVLVGGIFYFRYEAYLVACSLVVPAVLIARFGIGLQRAKRSMATWLAAWTLVFLLYPFFSRAWVAYQEAGYGFLHEFQNNYQAGTFLEKYYNDSVVVMDELGVSSFLSPGRKLDMMTGIADMEVTATRVDGFNQLAYIEFLLKKEKPAIALISEKKYHPYLTQHWIKVATWFTSFKVGLTDTQLSIFAIDPAAADGLRSRLKEFQASMPPGIKVEYY